MSDVSNLLRRNLGSIFNQRDSAKREAALADLWAEEGVLWTSDGVHIGLSAIAKAIAQVQQQYPEYSFTLDAEVDEIPGVARVRWFLGAQGSAPALRGLDVIVVNASRITAMYRFLDGANF